VSNLADKEILVSNDAKAQATNVASRAGKYLTFELAGEEYAIPILKVREVVGRMDTTPVPGAPSFVLGVVNLRGRVIPVADLRRKFGLAQAAPTPQTCIVVVHVGDLEMGILADRVCEVLLLSADAIEDVPSFGPAIDTTFLLGIAKTSGRVRILLDVDKAIRCDPIAPPAEAAGA
jgi:purine-binding chemotaxis protein CheW